MTNATETFIQTIVAILNQNPAELSEEARWNRIKKISILQDAMRQIEEVDYVQGSDDDLAADFLAGMEEVE
jgi:hypothetical protein